MDRVAPVGGKGERSPWRQWRGVEHREQPGASPGPGFGWRHRLPLSPKPTGQDSETQGPAPTTTSSRRQDQISTGFNCWRAPSAQPGLARLGCAGRPVAIIIARDQSAEAGINSTLPDGQGQRGEKKGQPAAFIKHCPVCTAAGRGTRACAGTNIVAFSPGPHLGSVAARWTCMVGGRWPVGGRLWPVVWCCCQWSLLYDKTFFLSFSHHIMDPFLRKDRHGKIRQAGRGNWEGRLVAPSPAACRPCTLSEWGLWVDTPLELGGQWHPGHRVLGT